MAAVTPKPKSSFTLFFQNLGIGKEKEFFLENLSLLLSSGMPVSAALEAMKRTVRSRRLAEIVEVLETNINTGHHFWHSFQKTGLFPDYVVSLIRIGEESGRLGENLKLLSRQQSKDRALKDRVRSAMIYPSIVLSLTLTLGIAISWFVLPRLSSVFVDLRLKVPLLTRIFIGFGSFLQRWGLLAVPIFFGILFLSIWILFFRPKSKIGGEKILLVTPGVGELLKEVELSRLGYVLGSLLNAGVPVVHAMELLGQASGLESYGRLYRFIKSNMEDGNSFETCFKTFPKINKFLPVPVQQMIVAGEQSGKLEQIFTAIGANYEEKSEMTSQNLTVILEPVLLVIVWLGVGALALAVIVPLYSLVGGLQDNAGGVVSAPAPVSVHLSVPVKPMVPVMKAATSTQLTAANSVATTTLATSTPSVRGASISAAPVLISVAPGLTFLYARNQPNATAKIVGKIYARKIYASGQMADGWYAVVLDNGKNAWVLGDYVEIK